MTRILLVCLDGASTSLLALHMERAARRFDLDVAVRAVSEALVADYVGDADVILVGPQMGFRLADVAKMAGTTPVAAIGMRDYGRMDGEAVLAQALELLDL